VEVFWRQACGVDPRATLLASEVGDWLDLDSVEASVSNLFYLRGEGLGDSELSMAAERLLSDPVVHTCVVRELNGDVSPARTRGDDAAQAATHVATVRKKTGVMEPTEASLLRGLADLGIDGVDVRTASRVRIATDSLGELERLDDDAKLLISEKVLSNAAIEDVFWDAEPIPSPFTPASPYTLTKSIVRLEGLSDDELLEVSRTGQLSLDLEEMRTIRAHFARAGRDPTDAELETVAQTWSEHCCHKTLTARIEHRIIDADGNEVERIVFENLLKETIVRATETLREKETEPFCLSVFKDNAGVIAFDDEFGISFKVETHNHPSAIEPYGGSGTGIGGVLRDTLGTGLGAKPIINTDVFCFGPPDLPRERVPAGALHPMRVLRGVVRGVRDYGNRMGIPTASGALYFDERYVGNPLVYCGSVGILPRDMVEKDVRPGDRIVVLGGRTGRDGIHGATFSSVELTEESESVSSGAVQIGNAITEKKTLDVLLEARDRRLYRGVTDCGAGGFSSAVGEMGEHTGARVDLDRVPLKYEGLSYWEIWISEAQERMVFAVPPENLAELTALAASQDVECTDIGEFTDTGRLELLYEGEQVCDLEMKFLHDGRPAVTRRSEHHRLAPTPAVLDDLPKAGELLRRILSSPNVASKEWVIRQYDHEVQGRSVLKPLVGVRSDGPGDACVFTPRFGSLRGIALGCGMNPCFGDVDPYRMALSAIDEAVRNVVAVGGDPSRLAILDNYCWGNTDRPETLGSLVEASRGCHDAAVLLGAPFVSGKDSLNNEFRTADGTLSIPPSLLISSLAIVEDVSRCVSMDLKAAGNRLILIGETHAELGGSHLLRVLGKEGGEAPNLAQNAPRIHAALARAITDGLVRSCHDLSEGGLAVAVAEMAFSGEIGAEIDLAKVPGSDKLSNDIETLFSESNTRFLVEVRPDDVERLLAAFDGLSVEGGRAAADVGETLTYHILRATGRDGETVLAEALDDLKSAWQTPLAFDRG
jgi:phosphoribosylformylglycinamidine synthase